MSTTSDHISQQDIEAALQSVAQLIEAHGEKYWPVFERLENELAERRSRSQRLRRILKMERL